jgi:hypothetical protein
MRNSDLRLYVAATIGLAATLAGLAVIWFGMMH